MECIKFAGTRKGEVRKTARKAYEKIFAGTKSEEREKGKIAGTSVRNLWDVLFWLQETYPNEEWLERDINTISKLLKQIQDEFNGISLTDFNFEFFNSTKFLLKPEDR